MTSQEFVLWLKGFTEGVHEFNVSPKQWDILKEKLAEVKDEEKFIGRGAPTSPFMPGPNPMWQQPHYPDINRVTCDTATGKTLLKDSTYNYTYKYNDGKSV